MRARSDEGHKRVVARGFGRAEPGRGQQEPRVLGRVTDVERSREHAAQHRRRRSGRGDRPRRRRADLHFWKGRTPTRSTSLSTSDGGQIRTSAALNHEEKSSYSVAVRVTDGRGGTDAVNVTIRVTDVDGEAPATPFAPTVTAVSSTSLSGELGSARQPGAAHHRLRLPVPGAVGLCVDGGHQHDDHGRRRSRLMD